MRKGKSKWKKKQTSLHICGKLEKNLKVDKVSWRGCRVQTEKRGEGERREKAGRQFGGTQCSY